MLTVIIALFIFVVSSFFLGITTMPKLYKLNATGKKIFWTILIFFIVAPCVILALYYIINKYNANPWIEGPMAFLIMAWLFSGFLSKIVFNTLTGVKDPKRKKKSTKTNFTKAEITKRYKFGYGFVILAIAIWIFGFVIGYGNYDTPVFILFLYLLIQGIVFILGNRKLIADGKVKNPTPKAQAEKDTANEVEE